MKSKSSSCLFITAIILASLMIASGCTESIPTDSLVKVWGRRGLDDARFLKPRAIAVDKHNQLFIVDMTGRIQVFDDQQQFLRSWRTPEVRMGKPCGLTISNDGLLMVADTHYHRILFYKPTGEFVSERTIGGTQGIGRGEFGYVTDVVQDSQDNYYVSEYGEFDRIQKFSPAGEFLFQWGGRGSDDGQFLRPQGLAIDGDDHLWVVDASNHRVQVFDATGNEAVHLKTWGEQGHGPGQMRYPFDIVLKDELVFVCEFGNHRVQRFTRDGESCGSWGGPGREPGQMHQPWAMTIDGANRMHVLDSYNHRVQTLNCDSWHWPTDTKTTEGDEHVDG